MTTFEIELRGDSSSLQVLGRLPLPDGVRVEQTKTGAVIRTSPPFEPANRDDVGNLASRTLEWLNGYGALADPSYRPVDLSSVRYGSLTIHATLHVLVHFSDRDILDATTLTPPNLTEELVRVGLNDPVATKILHFYGRYPRDWVALHKVFELIARDVGGLKRLMSKRWLADATLESLTESANNPTLSGDLARHAASRPRYPEARHMSLPDADECIRRLLLHWLSSKAAQRR